MLPFIALPPPESYNSLAGGEDVPEKQPHRRPNMSYRELIAWAISESVDGRLRVKDIYRVIANKYPYYPLKDVKPSKMVWQKSIRHNLSKQSCFIKGLRNGENRREGNFWSIRRSCKRYRKGSYNRVTACSCRELQAKSKVHTPSGRTVDIPVQNISFLVLPARVAACSDAPQNSSY